MTEATLVIIRHGETEYNRQHLITGHHDIPLTPEGEAQARAAGEAISHIRIDKIFASTLKRAFDTAALAMQAANDDIEAVEALMEVNVGDFNGRSNKTDAEIQHFFKTRRLDTKPPNGESEKDVIDRVSRFFNTRVRGHLEAGKNVLIATHSGVVRVFDVVLGLEEPPADGRRLPFRQIENAKPAVFAYKGGKFLPLA